MFDGSGFTVTGIDLGLRGEFKKFLEGIFNIRRTRVGKVGPANTLIEKGVTGKKDVVFGGVERNAALGVAGSVDNGEVGERGRKGFLRGEKDVWRRNRCRLLFGPVEGILRGFLVEVKILRMNG